MISRTPSILDFEAIRRATGRAKGPTLAELIAEERATSAADISVREEAARLWLKRRKITRPAGRTLPAGQPAQKSRR